MGRPKQFDERIQLTLVEGTTGRIDALLEDGEYRLDFIRTDIEVEIAKRSQESRRRSAASHRWRACCPALPPEALILPHSSGDTDRYRSSGS